MGQYMLVFTLELSDQNFGWKTKVPMEADRSVFVGHFVFHVEA
jgi:hypothetical protein